jgi:hypothetical protein
VNQSKRWPSRPSWGRSISAIVVPLLAILLLPGAVLGQARPVSAISSAASDHSATLLEGIVISPRLGLAYVMRPGGGIDALDLAGGALRWRSDGAAKPLALAGDRLIAQAASQGANALDLVAFDARTGAQRDSVRISLPEGVAAPLADTVTRSFRIRADVAGAELVVRWESTASPGPAQGYLPAEDEGQAPVVVAGAAVLDTSSSLRVKTEPSIRSVRSASLTRSSLEELRTPAVANAQGRQMLSADGRHVLATQRAQPSGASPLDQNRWTIYERASGTRLGSLTSMVSAAPFVVVGKTLFHVEPAHAVRNREGGFDERPASLRAVNLATGAEVWTKAVGETSFRGPFPP